MKIDVPRPAAAVWRFLSEVPGRPDARPRARWLRALPLLVPAVAVAGLLAWSLAVQRPRLRELRAAQAELTALEARVEALNLRCSEDEAERARLAYAETLRRLPAGPDDLAPRLRRLRTQLHEGGWDSSFQLTDSSLEVAPEDVPLGYLAAKGRLAPLAGDTRPQLARLFHALELLPAGDPPADVTRLAVRADDQGRYAVEFNLRFGAQPRREKTP